MVGEIAAYFKVPSVIGELVAGILLGPSVFGWVEISAPIQLLAQIGIILLLFEVGLETDIARLGSSGIKALTVAIGGVILPFIAGFAISSYIYSTFLCLLAYLSRARSQPQVLASLYASCVI